MSGDSPPHTREARGLACEIKFVVDRSLGHEVRGWARTNLHPDPYGTGPFGDEYQTTTLYFDTPELDVLNRRGSYGRAKYRVRRYGAGTIVFLERKLRRPRLLVKRRTRIPLPDLAALNTPIIETWPGDWFERRLRARRLVPACQISYRRTARGTLADGGMARLTLDDGLSSIALPSAGFVPEPGVGFLEDKLILELKFRVALPQVFTRLIEEFRLVPRTASKYRFGMAALGHVTAAEEPAVVALPDIHA